MRFAAGGLEAAGVAGVAGKRDASLADGRGVLMDVDDSPPSKAI